MHVRLTDGVAIAQRVNIVASLQCWQHCRGWSRLERCRDLEVDHIGSDPIVAALLASRHCQKAMLKHFALVLLRNALAHMCFHMAHMRFRCFRCIHKSRRAANWLASYVIMASQHPPLAFFAGGKQIWWRSIRKGSGLASCCMPKVPPIGKCLRKVCLPTRSPSMIFMKALECRK